jgi:hypothetical protein
VKEKSLNQLDELMSQFKHDVKHQKRDVVESVDDEHDSSDASGIISDTSSSSIWEPGDL